MARQTLYTFTHTQTASNGVAGAVQFALVDGTTITIDTALLSREIISQALAHGLKQKIADAAAMPCNPDTGKSATAAEKIEAMRAVADRLLGGEWNATREGGGTTGGMLLRALVEHTGKDVDTIKAFLATKDDKQKAALRTNPKVAVIIERMKAEAGKSTGIDSDELLGDLMG